MLSLLGVAVSAAYHVVSAFALVLTPVAGGLATAGAIIAFTIAVRLLLLPLSYRATRGLASQARVLPQLQALQKRHAGDPDRLRRELADLYKREGTGRFAGFLPALLQLPFFSVMYQLFRSGTIGGRPNGLLGHRLLGAALGSHWLNGPGPLSAQGAVFAGLFALLAIVAWVAGRTARTSGTAGSTGAAGQAPAATSALARVLPFVTVVVAAFMPLATGIYLLTTTAWSACERAIMARRALARRTTPEAPRAPAPRLPARTRSTGRPVGRRG